VEVPYFQTKPDTGCTEATMKLLTPGLGVPWKPLPLLMNKTHANRKSTIFQGFL
jgi:hypothetical protein